MPKARSRTRLDLTESVTVFLTTVGAPSFEPCLEHLHRQDCSFRLEVIDHVAPISAAYQQMLDLCATDFFVILDEDMLLYPRAIRALHERISASETAVVGYVANLYDVHLRRCIHGLKIFRHRIVRSYPFYDVEGCDLDQVRRLEKDGLMVVREPQKGARTSPATLGLHGAHWTRQSIYERYLTLERRRRRDSSILRWFGHYPERFLKSYLEDPCELNFFALMGPIAAAWTYLDGSSQEKDYRRYDDLPGWKSLCAFYDEISRHRESALSASRSDSTASSR